MVRSPLSIFYSCKHECSMPIFERKTKLEDALRRSAILSIFMSESILPYISTNDTNGNIQYLYVKLPCEKSIALPDSIKAVIVINATAIVSNLYNPVLSGITTTSSQQNLCLLRSSSDVISGYLNYTIISSSSIGAIATGRFIISNISGGIQISSSASSGYYFTLYMMLLSHEVEIYSN